MSSVKQCASPWDEACNKAVHAPPVSLIELRVPERYIPHTVLVVAQISIRSYSCYVKRSIVASTVAQGMLHI